MKSEPSLLESEPNLNFTYWIDAGWFLFTFKRQYDRNVRNGHFAGITFEQAYTLAYREAIEEMCEIADADEDEDEQTL